MPGHSTDAKPASTGRSVEPGPAERGPLALYVHIPFCETKCPYCDFNTYARLEHLIPSYLQALQRELVFWGEALGHPPVRTIFLGGGTPSLLTPGQLEGLLQCLRDQYTTTVVETTLEANPGDLTLEKARAYRELGVDRVSMGVQALDDKVLAVLGRRHSAREALEAHDVLRRAGFDNLNLDFIFGVPYQSIESWQDTVEQALALAPEHLSLYGLTLEPNTPMTASVGRGELPDPDPDLAADMYLYARERLHRAGYTHYEISNWAGPGWESRHNLVYWRNEPYLGVGPGAHSSLDGLRFSVLRSPREYIRRVATLPAATEGTTACEGHPRLEPALLQGIGILEDVEDIERDMAMSETMMLGLRLAEGVSNATFAARFGVRLEERYAGTIIELLDLGLVRWQGDRLELTADGQLLGNEVFGRFVAG